MKQLLTILSLAFIITIGCAQDNPPFIETPETQSYSYKIVADGIDIPWGLAFITPEDFLVTEKSGTLYRVVNGIKTTVEGLPPIYTRGQGGLLDVALHPDFSNNNIIYITLSTDVEEDGLGGNTKRLPTQIKANIGVLVLYLIKKDICTFLLATEVTVMKIHKT
jgi:glucose/arabinose dehydrogenase